MNVTIHEDLDAFYQRVEPFLLAHEAQHNLLFSILHGARVATEDGPPPFMAAIEEEGEVVGVALRVAPHYLVLSRGIAGDAASALARAVAACQWEEPLEGVFGPTDASRAYAEAWHELLAQPFELERSTRVYQLECVEPLPPVPGQLRLATSADRALLVRWSDAFMQEAMAGEPGHDPERTVDGYLRRGSLYLWEDGGVVTQAVAQGPTPHGIRISFVYTPPELRRRGYATACVAALSQRLLDEGRRFVFLFTNLANPTSNHIYQEIGYRPVADMASYRLV